MDLGLAGRVAVVGGSSAGIGYAIARLLAADGARVAMVARRAEPLAAAAARIAAETGGRTLAIPADIRRAADCERIIDETAAAFGRLDILVNNDGAPPLGALAEFDDAAWDKAVQQNLMSAVRLSRRAIPHMKRAGGGRIVNITALSALQPIARFGLSVATWAGVIGYAKTLSLEVAADGITVNTVCPGRIATGRLSKVFGSGADAPATPAEDAKLAAELARLVPLGRLGRPEDIAGLVALLASDYGAYITGATMHVDGGRRASLL
jgi:3-oxoacyl-[acyl-carrier protein] reductase